MYRFYELIAGKDSTEPLPGEVPWSYPYGLIEKVWLVLWGVLGLSGVVFRDQIIDPNQLLVISVGMLATVLVVPQITVRLGQRAFQFGRIGLSIVSAWFTYERANQFIASLRSTSYELEMLVADRLLFGGNPSEWAQTLANPVLTEYLQVMYLGYFPMMLLVGLALLAARKDRHFYTYLLAMNFAMITCHLFYVLVPVRSPFLIADMEPYRALISYGVPLQGLWLTDTLRQQLLETTTMRYDCFPSGHTMHSLLAMYFGWKAHPYMRSVLVVIGTSIIFSTIYLRYHYAIDLIAGGAFALFWIWASHEIARRTWAHEPVAQDALGPRILSVFQHWPGKRPD